MWDTKVETRKLDLGYIDLGKLEYRICYRSNGSTAAPTVAALSLLLSRLLNSLRGLDKMY